MSRHTLPVMVVLGVVGVLEVLVEGLGCSEGLFACGEGRCIQSKFVCDGNINCHNGLDEKGCTETSCSSSAVFCAGHCAHRCDGIARCPDGADERGCPTRPIFECKPGQTVLSSRRCDGIGNCDEGEDEEGCSFPEDCIGGAVFCDGRCWPESIRCDRVVWCSDGADEIGCDYIKKINWAKVKSR